MHYARPPEYFRSNASNALCKRLVFSTHPITSHSDSCPKKIINFIPRLSSVHSSIILYCLCASGTYYTRYSSSSSSTSTVVYIHVSDASSTTRPQQYPYLRYPYPQHDRQSVVKPLSSHLKRLLPANHHACTSEILSSHRPSFSSTSPPPPSLTYAYTLIAP